MQYTSAAAGEVQGVAALPGHALAPRVTPLIICVYVYIIDTI
jgi:hypothetical protein